MSYSIQIHCLKFSVFALMLLFQQPVKGQQNFNSFKEAIEARKKLLGNDLVVMLATGDSVFFLKEYGDFSSQTQAPIASCSKWLTATLVMQFVDEGLLSLDDRITKWLPEFERYGKNYITVRHCLSHMTGIQSEQIRLLTLLQRRKYNSLADEVNDFAKKEIHANPGTEFRYSNIGLNIAGRILEIISKRKFDALIRQKLFVPLEMRNTTFGTTDGAAINPSGGARSTAADYMKFLQMLLNNGMHKGRRVLSETSIAELRKVQTTSSTVKYAPRSADGFNYASGSWVLSDDKTVASALASPGLFGTWPMVDFCRGYACIFFVKSFLGEQKADAYMEIKKELDKQFPCKI